MVSGVECYFVLFSVSDASRVRDYGKYSKTLESQNDKKKQNAASDQALHHMLTECTFKI